MTGDSHAVRFVRGLEHVVDRIMDDQLGQIERASEMIADALAKGHNAFFVSEGHVPPLANGYGASGNPNLFLPLEYLMAHLGYGGMFPLKGDVVVFEAQFDGGSWLDDLAVRAKLLGAITIFIGTRSDRSVIPLSQPSLSLVELCDLTIDVFTPMRDGLLRFEGLDIEACPTSGITGILVFNVLNIEVAEILSRNLQKSAEAIGISEEDRQLAETPTFLKPGPMKPPTDMEDGAGEGATSSA